MQISVFKTGQLAGTLTAYTSHVEFSYDAGYRGEPVASTLPIRAEPFSAPARQLPAFFAGLLPEGRRLSALRRALKVSADDELSLLLAVGGSTVGDITVAVAGDKPNTPEPIIASEDWADLDLQQMFDRSIGSDGSVPRFDRSAIPGEQPKLSGKTMTFPAGGRAGPVIVKLNPPDVHNLVENEYAMLEVARAAGFNVPRTEVVHDVNGAAALVVERFDRTVGSNGNVVPHPVEDGCQVLGRYPADKYQVDSVETIESLSSICAAPPIARFELLRRFLLSYLVGDGDFHARNMAVYKSDDLWRPTPVFDLVCTVVYGDMTLANPFGGDADVREIGRNRLLEGVAPLNLPAAAVANLLDTKAGAIAELAIAALDTDTFTSFPNRTKAKRIISRRVERLI